MAALQKSLFDYILRHSFFVVHQNFGIHKDTPDFRYVSERQTDRGAVRQGGLGWCSDRGLAVLS